MEELKLSVLESLLKLLMKMFNYSKRLAYLNDKIIESKKSSYNYSVYDSDVETKFAKDVWGKRRS